LAWRGGEKTESTEQMGISGRAWVEKGAPCLEEAEKRMGNSMRGKGQYRKKKSPKKGGA